MTLFGRRWLRLGWLQAVITGSAGALMNFGLMLLDARLQDFSPAIEMSISARYASPTTLLACAVATAAAGLAGLWWVSYRVMPRKAPDGAKAR
jgi:hypothetical protein